MIARATRFLVYLGIFFGMLYLRARLPQHHQDEALPYFLIVGAVAAAYLLYFIVSEGYLAEVIGCLVVSVLIDAIAMIFPILAILVVIWFLINAAAAIQSIIRLAPLALASVVLYLLLFPDTVFRALGLQDLVGAPVLIAYALFALIYAAVASRDPLKLGLFKMATMLLSVPIIALLVASIQAGLRNLFQQSFTSTSRSIKLAQNVRAHIRAGQGIDAYTRHVTRTVTDVSVATRVGAVGTDVAVAAAGSKVAAAQTRRD